MLRGHGLLADEPESSAHGRRTALIPTLFHRHHILEITIQFLHHFPTSSFALPIGQFAPGIPNSRSFVSLSQRSSKIVHHQEKQRERERERTAHPPGTSSVILSWSAIPHVSCYITSSTMMIWAAGQCAWRRGSRGVRGWEEMRCFPVPIDSLTREGRSDETLHNN